VVVALEKKVVQEADQQIKVEMVDLEEHLQFMMILQDGIAVAVVDQDGIQEIVMVMVE
jgi:hypothetical protein